MSNSDPFYNSACLPSGNLQNPAQPCQTASGLSTIHDGCCLLAEKVHALLIQALQPQGEAGLQTSASLTATMRGLNTAVHSGLGNEESV